MRKDDFENNVTQNVRLPSRSVSLFVYNFFLSLYAVAIRIYALFNDKARKWIEGRKDWEHNLENTLRADEKRVWVHCSSVGEFEQARPLIEALKEQFPRYKIVVTFFSPSGFDACKNNSAIDYIFYLPVDSKANAERFIALIQPSLVMFIKYEFWYHYLAQLHKCNIPVVLVSGAFRNGQVFFKWYGGLFRDMLQCFTFFFLQDVQSKKVLCEIGFDNNILISGDTRYDRVSAVANSVSPIAAIEHFKGNDKILIAGSTWPGDEEVLIKCMPSLPANWKLIIVPHEIGAAHIRKVQSLFGNDAILFSELDAEHTGSDKKILVVNNVGMLSRLYACGDIAFVGGGFHKAGIHNILEPAVFGLPVIFGPVYEKFVEANELASLHYVFPVNNVEECNQILKKLITDDAYLKEISASLRNFIDEHTGATRTITDKIGIEKWL